MASGCNLLKNAMFINQHEVQVIVSKFLNFQVAQREVHSLVVVVVVLEGAQVAVIRPSDDHASMEEVARSSATYWGHKVLGLLVRSAVRCGPPAPTRSLKNNGSHQFYV